MGPRALFLSGIGVTVIVATEERFHTPVVILSEVDGPRLLV
jgi:hypothetical protein